MKDIRILLFYKFKEIKNPKEFVNLNRTFCEKLGLLGKILIAKEGINGSVSGSYEKTEEYKEFLRSQYGFEDVVFKEEMSVSHPFTKLVVRVKKEIVALNKDVDTKKGGKYLSPKHFLELYEKNKDMVILDIRNDYECKVGRFKNSVNPNIKTFRQFPEFVEKFKENKDKKIVMYCTGGIRCEKASAYMIEQGFKDISQLDGGVITYCQNLPGTLWEGSCFVFDKRLVSDVENSNKPVSTCKICNDFSELYRNCKNPYCDLLTIMCVPCQEKLHGCCSDECLIEFQKYCLERARSKKVMQKSNIVA